MRNLFTALVLLFLFATEILRVYFIMPFPGSQQENSIAVAYWLSRNIWWLRLGGLLILAFLLIDKVRRGKPLPIIGWGIALLLYGFVFFMFNYRFEADKMFYQPENKSFSSAAADTSNGSGLVIGVVINGEAKAYPIEIIGYHHQVRDTVGRIPVMVTYCTVCRTGRVFSPEVEGKAEHFRLVGMDHFNAMFEDATTGSWWRQATGEAIAGEEKGKKLPEIYSQQVTLASWVRQYPQTLILRPDPVFRKKYEGLKGYDVGIINSKLEKRDSASGHFKSWVVGVQVGKNARSYDWNLLRNKGLLEDSLAGLPLVVFLEKDTNSFHAFSRNVGGVALQFQRVDSTGWITDTDTHSLWSPYGLCTQGQLKGLQLGHVRAYQEFWHSWKTFHPDSE